MQFKSVGEAAAQLFNRLAGHFPFDAEILESSRHDLTQLVEQWLKDALSRLDLVSRQELVAHQRAVTELVAQSQALELKVQQLEQQLESKIGSLEQWAEQGQETNVE